MPQAVPEAIQSTSIVQRPDTIVLVQIGDVADLRDCQPAVSWPRCCAADSNGPKRAAKSRSWASVRR